MKESQEEACTGSQIHGLIGSRIELPVRAREVFCARKDEDTWL